jgi:hypothetical protein
MPFFLIAALFVVGFIGALLLAPKPHIENAKAAQLSDFQFPRSDEGDPVPKIYGTVKSKGVNTIGQCNFKAVPIKKKVKTGLFSSKKQTVGYKYYTGLNLAVCLGPGIVYRRLWYGNHLIWAGCLYEGGCVTREFIDLPELLGGDDNSDGSGSNGGIKGWVAFYCGAFDQPANDYLQANLTKVNADDVCSAMPGISHMVFEDFYWGNSPNIQTISVEVSQFSNGLGLSLGKYVMANGLDANPIEVLYDICINDWGMLGIVDPIFNMTSWRDAAYTCYDEGNGVSAEIANANQAGDLFKQLLRQVNGMIYQNPQTGMIDIVLMRKDYVVADLPVLGPDQISSLRNFSKLLWDQTFNRVRIKYKNRDNDYQPAVATADDFGNIRYQKRVKATDIGMPMCYTSDLANALAARELSNLNVPLYQAELTCDRTNTAITPGKCFVLNWPEYNLAGIVMRVRKMGLGTRKDGKITYTVVQDEFASDAVVVSAPVPPTTDGADYQPKDITAPAPVMFELPYWLANAAGDTPVAAGRTYYGTFAKKQGGASLDYSVYDNDNDPDYGDTQMLDRAPYTPTATIVGAIGKYDGFATGVIPALNIANVSSTAILKDGTTAAIQSTGAGLFYLNAELWAYETRTDNGDGTWTLNNAYRALLDTEPVASAAGATLYFFDGQEAFWNVDVAVAAFQAYALDRAVSGHSSEAGATLVNLNPVERQALPLPPDFVTVAASRATNQFAVAGDIINIAWLQRNRLDAAIAFETDASIAPEAATTYTINLRSTVDNVVYQTQPGVAAGTGYALTIDPALPPQQVNVEVVAVRGGKSSFTAGKIPLLIISPYTLIVDGAIVTVDGETVET